MRLRAGDVEWWDFRSWKGGAMIVPVVVGAFPEPFLHGFNGDPGGATVVVERRDDRAVARKLARIVRGNVLPPPARRSRPLPAGNVVVVDPSLAPATARAERRGDRVALLLGVAAARRLAADPHALRCATRASAP